MLQYWHRGMLLQVLRFVPLIYLRLWMRLPMVLAVRTMGCIGRRQVIGLVRHFLCACLCDR